MAKPTGYGGRDYPDFGITQLNSTKVTITDLSELAARLGAINTLDRRGNQLFRESFEHGLGNWQEGMAVFGSTAILSSNHYATYPPGVHIQVAANEGAYYTLTHRLPIPYIARFGFEFRVMAYTTFDEFIFKGTIYDGSAYHAMWFIFDVNTPSVRVSTKGSGYVDLDVGDPYTGPVSAFHTFKLVGDVNTGYYVRLVMDALEFDISPYQYPTGISDQSPMLNSFFQLTNFNGAACEAVLDDYIVTINEPQK